MKCQNCNREYREGLPSPIHCVCGNKIITNNTLPSITTQALNFTKAIVKQIVSGNKTVPQEIFEKNMDFCKSCDRYNLYSDQCNMCGCKMSTKAKWASQKCPIGKWDNEVYTISHGHNQTDS